MRLNWSTPYAFKVACITTLILCPNLVAAVQVPEITITGRRSNGIEHVLRRGDALATGDGIRINVTVAERAYVYVVALGATGSAVLLQPFSRDPSDALMSNAARRVIPQANAVLSLDRHVGEETIVALASATPIRDVDGLLLAIEAEAASGGLINPAGLSAYGKATEFHFAHSARSQIAVEKLRPSLFANQPAESGVMASAGSRISALLGGGTKASAPSTPPSDAFAALRADAPAPRPRSAPPAADVGVAPAVEVASSRSTTQPVIGRAAATSSATDEPSGGWVTRLFGDSDDVQPAASRASQQVNADQPVADNSTPTPASSLANETNNAPGPGPDAPRNSAGVLDSSGTVIAGLAGRAAGAETQRTSPGSSPVLPFSTPAALPQPSLTAPRTGELRSTPARAPVRGASLAVLPTASVARLGRTDTSRAPPVLVTRSEAAPVETRNGADSVLAKPASGAANPRSDVIAQNNSADSSLRSPQNPVAREPTAPTVSVSEPRPTASTQALAIAQLPPVEQGTNPQSPGAGSKEPSAASKEGGFFSRIGSFFSSDEPSPADTPVDADQVADASAASAGASTPAPILVSEQAVAVPAVTGKPTPPPVAVRRNGAFKIPQLSLGPVNVPPTESVKRPTTSPQGADTAALANAGSRIAALLGFGGNPDKPQSTSVTTEGAVGLETDLVAPAKQELPEPAQTAALAAEVSESQRPQPLTITPASLTAPRVNTPDVVATAISRRAVPRVITPALSSEAPPLAIDPSAEVAQVPLPDAPTVISVPRLEAQSAGGASGIAEASTVASIPTAAASSLVTELAPVETLGLTPNQARVELDPNSSSGPSGAVMLVVTPASHGTALLIDDKGHLLTPWHVVEGFSTVTVWLKAPGQNTPASSEPRVARVIRINRQSDLALLALEDPPETAQPLTLANSAKLKRGEIVHLLGHANGDRWTHVMARFSRLKPRHSWVTSGRFVHREAVLSNSATGAPAATGGAVFNSQMQLVGLNVQIGRNGDQVYSVTVDVIRRFLAGDVAPDPSPSS